MGEWGILTIIPWRRHKLLTVNVQPWQMMVVMTMMQKAQCDIAAFSLPFPHPCWPVSSSILTAWGLHNSIHRDLGFFVAYQLNPPWTLHLHNSQNTWIPITWDETLHGKLSASTSVSTFWPWDTWTWIFTFFCSVGQRSQRLSYQHSKKFLLTNLIHKSNHFVLPLTDISSTLTWCAFWQDLLLVQMNSYQCTALINIR